MKRLTVLGLAVLAIMLLGACAKGDELREERFDAQREVFDDRFEAAAEAERMNDGESDGESDSDGDPDGLGDAPVQGVTVAEHYANTCVACHGAERQGGVGLPLLPDRLTEEDEFYTETIKNGRSGTAMVAYGGGPELTDDEVQSIVTWLKNTTP